MLLSLLSCIFHYVLYNYLFLNVAVKTRKLVMIQTKDKSLCKPNVNI